MINCLVRWTPLLFAGGLIFGCATGTGSPPPEGAWPWAYDKDYDKLQTKGYAAVTGSVASFGEAPKPAGAVTDESLEEVAAVSIPPSKAAMPEDTRTTAEGKVTAKYPFTLKDSTVEVPSYLPVGSVPVTHAVTASNSGDAPVSVMVDIDRDASENVSTDKTLPLVAVLPPHSEQILFTLSPRTKGQHYGYKYKYLWSIGDYRARHDCPEGYQFPFPKYVKAFATVDPDIKAAPSTRYSVTFYMKKGTPVLAARKGTVVQIKGGDKVDVLHDDLTVASYAHLGRIADDVVVGKTVTTEDIIGWVGGLEKEKEGDVDVTVWRPQPKLPKGFEFESFPLSFCNSDVTSCMAITRNQEVSRLISKLNGSKRQKRYR